MDRRTALAPGTKLVFRTATGSEQYTVLRETGRGASCIVYDAAYADSLQNRKLVRIKECCPHAMRLRRLEDGSLQAEERDAERFEKKKEAMRDAYQRQHDLFYADSLMTAVASAANFHAAYGTVYIVSAYADGETLARHACSSVRECAALALSTARALEKIHREGYLYLDLKPENIWVLRGGGEAVQLFDFDSLVSLEELRRPAREGEEASVRIRCSRGFAPPEQAAGRLFSLGETADVYSLGAVLFFLLWGRAPGAFDREPDAVFDYGEMKFPADKYPDRLLRALTDFFRRTLAYTPADRYPSMAEAAARLEEICALSGGREPRILSAPVSPPAFFTGRETDLRALAALLRTPGHRCFSLCGMGGIGKSTLARQCVAACREEYDAVVWMYDRGSAQAMLADDSCVCVSTVERYREESGEEYAARKMDALRRLASERRVLAVVDNLETAHLDDVLPLRDVGWDLLLISREALPEGLCPSLRLGEMDAGDLTALFVHYARAELKTEEDRADFRSIARAVSGHTLTMEMVARQIAGSHLTLREAAELVRVSGAAQLPGGEVDYIRDGRVQRVSPADVLDRLAGADRLPDAEKRLMKVLSVLDDRGIRIALLRELADDPAPAALHGLEASGWVSCDGERIRLHPLLREIFRGREWDAASRQALGRIMRKLARRMDRVKADADATGRFRERNREMAELRGAGEQLLSAQDVPSPAGQHLRFVLLMESPLDRDEETVRRIRELLGNPAFLKDGEILRLYERSAYLLGRLGRFPEALAQLEEMKRYLGEHPGMFYLSLYHRAKATVLHDADMYGNAAEALAHADRAIFAARISRHPKAGAQLAGCLTDKATALISSEGDDEQAGRLIREAEPLIERFTGEYDEERYLFLCVSAMHAARRGDAGRAERSLAEAGRIADTARVTDLDYIDHLTDQATWIYRAMGKHGKAADALREAIRLCGRHEGEKRYYHVRISTWLFLAEILEEAGERERAGKAKAVARALIARSPWPIAPEDPILMR